MLVAFYCKDKNPDNQRLRLECLEAHLQWAENNMDAIQVAGPLKYNGQIFGSFYILQAATVDEASAILSKDPYY